MITKNSLVFQYADKALKDNQRNTFAYSVLVEAYALLGDTKNFYETLELALQNGYPLWEQLDEPVYERYVHQRKFQELLKKYHPEEQKEQE